MPTPPNTVSQLSHAMAIRLPGRTVGAINEWNPRINRTITDLYEFGQVTGPYAQNPGEPFEAVPGNVSGMQIDCRRWDQYTDQLELEVPGNGVDLTMLSNQFDAFYIREVWTSPGRTNDYAESYGGCWWQDQGRTLDAKGDRTINAGGTIRYTRRDRTAVTGI